MADNNWNDYKIVREYNRKVDLIYAQSSDTIIEWCDRIRFYNDPTLYPSETILPTIPGGLHDDIIVNYKNTVLDYGSYNQQDIYVEWANVCLSLQCLELPPNIKGMYLFRWQNDKYQYDLRTNLGKGRPVAWRVPFLNSPDFDDSNNYTVSHLCHNNQCYNWNHHVLEPLPVNKGRNGCPGLGRCCHKRKCIRPGPYHNQ